MIETLLATYRSVIALDCKEVIHVPLRKGVPVIAADGAVRWITADYIVGDGDSSDDERLIRIDDQNSTDFEKCIAFAKEKELLPALVVGVSGGEIDHILGNIQALLKHSERQSLFFLDPPSSEKTKIGIPLEKGRYHLFVKSGTNISFIPFASCSLSTTGLVWELNDHHLTYDGILAIRNRSQQQQVTFDIKEGKLLVVIDNN